MSNVCIRCGKERIVVKQWTESVDTERRTNKIYHSFTSCPDPECQKKVDKSLALEKQKNEQRLADRAEKDRIEKDARQKRAERVSELSRKRK